MSPNLKRRRSTRIAEERPIQVAGTNVEGIDFLAPSHTILLSRYGAKILCEQALGLDQEITIYHPETGEDCLAKVVGLYDRLSGGYSYGIEFLDPDRDFWNFAFPSGDETTETRRARTSAPKAEEVPTASMPPEPSPTAPSAAEFQPRFHPAFGEPPASAPLPVRKDYAVRMKCPHGGEDQWVLLRAREESPQQIQGTLWDFPCPIHGMQRELPMEVRETLDWSLQDPDRALRVEEEIRIKRQKEARTQQAVRVWVYGTDPSGNPFSQTAYSVDVSRSGARLEGVGFLTAPGMTIEIKRGWKKARFRVVWVGGPGTSRAGQVGVLCLEPDKNIWGIR
jgi:hypothetical protein